MLKTDTFYIDRCLDGHPDDFRFLVQRYQGALIGHLVSKLGSLDSAEEAAQESFVRAYFKVNTLKKPESFFAWLLGIGDLHTETIDKAALDKLEKNIMQTK